jgi:pyrroline-5-carboxylate reductase
MTGPLLLVGCGKMGGALLEGWIEKGVAAQEIWVVEPSGPAARERRERFAVRVVESPDSLEPEFRPGVIVFAVKPQGLGEVVPAYARFAAAGAVFLSIAAGKPIRFFAERLGETAAIVRAMPNTPASIRRGISVACANKAVTPEQRRLCLELLEAVGEAHWVDDESLLDAVTAVSGSGPAYLFLFVECLARAGAEMGLPAELSARLACATVAGSAELLRRSGAPPAKLREDVTSPKGTTEAALRVLRAEGGLAALMSRAVKAARQRSRELAAEGD